MKPEVFEKSYREFTQLLQYIILVLVISHFLMGVLKFKNDLYIIGLGLLMLKIFSSLMFCALGRIINKA